MANKQTITEEELHLQEITIFRHKVCPHCAKNCGTSELIISLCPKFKAFHGIQVAMRANAKK